MSSKETHLTASGDASPSEEEGRLVIQAEGLSKYYPARLTVGRLLRYLTTLPLAARSSDFGALRDVSFHVGRGEVVGIIGPNGSGKSTLLQIIAGLLEPTTGRVRVRGRTAALLELGAGFNPEFTGRENIFLSGAVYGMSRRMMLERYDDIVAFADIGPHLDQAVKTYSSGMYARLAFAVAIEVDPDIILVDEALSVGDVGFQAKCFRRIEQLRERGTSILFVSHDINSVQTLCDRVILLHRGEKIAEGPPKEVTDAYLGVMSQPREGDAQTPSEAPSTMVRHKAEISDVVLRNSAGESTQHPRSGESCVLEYRVEFHSVIEVPVVTFQIKSMMGLVLFDLTNHFVNKPLSRCQPGDSLRVRVPFTANLCSGPYRIGVGVVDMGAGTPEPLFGTEALVIEVISERPEYGVVHTGADMELQLLQKDSLSHE
jgi:ABC-type polysaccharide/polyol phosphate transport system ATPase subunit